MLWLTDIEKGFGPQLLFSGVNWQLKPAQRFGLIGPNGVGKSTLLDIISGDQESDKGERRIQRELRLACLPQEVPELGRKTVREVAEAGLAELWALGDELRTLEESLGQESDQESLERYGQLQSRFELMGGFSASARVEEILAGLGFHESQFDRSCAELSGGWRVRALLAQLLLQSPDLLLLDEPTNHLDLESVAWLESFLQSFPGALILISHDRWFLDRICSHIAELSPSGLRSFTGNFSSYLEQRALLSAQLSAQRRSQERRAAELERFVERFRYKATKAKQAQSRLKQLEKMELVDDRDPGESGTIHFTIPEAPPSSRVMVTLDALSQGYGETLIYERLQLELLRGSRIALVGPNGAGKSTLLKLLGGQLTYQGGARLTGRGVKSYSFAQHQLESLDPALTVLQEAQGVDSDRPIAQLRGILGAFLFDADDIEKRVEVLSGGEKARLSLVKMLLQPVNLLLLDEPTNHLDMGSRAVLAEALRRFTGAVVLISHDRQFIDEVCEEIWEVQGGRITPFGQGYERYISRREGAQRPKPLPLAGERITADTEPMQAQGVEQEGQRGGKRKQEKRRLADWRAARRTALGPLEREIQAIEAEVQRLEEAQAALEAAQSEPSYYDNPAQVQAGAREGHALAQALEAALESWELRSEALSEAEAAFIEMHGEEGR
ncbi:MAG: ABC-F family ATP-binding cassette domain-containing protein [Myxococcota bacterium]|nr:ABC-F family ATP-binding cassette domain-containing protein [Myxococcota bacterium]